MYIYRNFALGFFCIVYLCAASYAHARSYQGAADIVDEFEKPLMCYQDDTSQCYQLTPDDSIHLENLNFEFAVDGQTLMASGRKIRLWGISSQGSIQDRSRVLIEALAKTGSLVCASMDMNFKDVAIMKCSISGADLGAMLVRMGMAMDDWHVSRGFYAYEQQRAQQDRRGLWK